MRRLAPTLGLWLALGACVALALVLRSLSFPGVFPAEGGVELLIGDSAYHARRALYSFANFPAVLAFDSYIAYPDGAPVPMPPLYDWALGGAARIWGDGLETFERVAAWSSPVLSALTVLPVFAAGRALGGTRLGLGAALLFALLPASARRSMLGDVDHHAAVALLGALWLALSLALVRGPLGVRRLIALGIALAGVRAALLLSWSGSLLYIVLGEGALLLAASLVGGRRVLAVQAAGCLLAAALVAPWLLSTGGSLGPAFTTTNLSWLHIGVLVTAAGAATAAAWASPSGVVAASRRIAAAACATGSVAALAVLMLPELRGFLDLAVGFFSREDSWAERNLEQQPLFFSDLGAPLGPVSLAHRNYGWLAYAIPLAWLPALARLRDPAQRGRAAVFGCWVVVLGTLALSQVRFSVDFAPSAAVAFALLLSGVGNAVARRAAPIPAAGVAIGLGAILLWPGWAATYGPRIPRALEALGSAKPTGRHQRLNGAESLARFMRIVRQVTPETSGYLDAALAPEYGILTRPSHGHTMQYMGRRPTPANNFGPYLDTGKYIGSELFYVAPDEGRAVAIADQLGVRYVVTVAHEAARPGVFSDRLHVHDGVGPKGKPPTRRFRLIAEGPAHGTPRATAFTQPAPADTIPYKLFELVEGAHLDVRAEPGTLVTAELPLVTAGGRRLSFRASTFTGPNGRGRLRVPYSTDPTPAVRAEGGYRLRLGDVELEVPVPESAVREGETIRVPPATD